MEESLAGGAMGAVDGGVDDGQTQGQSLGEEMIDAGQAEGETGGDDIPEQEKAKDQPLPKGVQRRIDRAVREKYQAQAEVQSLRRQLEAVQQQVAQQGQRQQAQEKPDSELSPAELVERIAERKARALFEERFGEMQRASQMHQERAQARAAQEQFVQVARNVTDRGVTDYQDWHEVVTEAPLPITPALVDAAAHEDGGHHVLYHLATNPQELLKIVNLPPARIGVAVARLADKLATQRKVSGAPAPGKPVGGRAVAGAPSLSGDDATAYIEHIRAQARKR